MNNKKLLITGSIGFIGSAIIRNIINNTDHGVISFVPHSFSHGFI